jgi:hypothetical protein
MEPAEAVRLVVVRRWAFAAACALFGALLLLAAACGSDEPPGPPSAVIVDQLSLTAPNPDFRTEATELLTNAGYTVDYVPGEDVTVDYYRNLGAHDYDLLLVRAHAAGFEGQEQAHASLFTSEPFAEERYTLEWQNDFLTAVAYDPADAAAQRNLLFAIPALFVEQRIRGDFDDATVILMGCDVLATPALAEAFLERGADDVVGWDKAITAEHTDRATLAMLRAMIDDGLEPPDAARAAIAEVGPDPVQGGVLLAYP